METDNLVTKSELNRLQLIDKLEQSNELLQSVVKQKERETDELLDKLEIFKQKNIKLTAVNEALSQKNKELEATCSQTKLEAHSNNDILESEIENLHEFILDLRKYIINDDELLSYFGEKADTIFEEAFKNGLFILKHEYLLGKNFPLPLLVELINEEFGIITTNYKLVKSGEDYKLTKNLTKNGKIEIQK
jgi:hypothetical protein